MASTLYHKIVIESASPLGVVRREKLASAAVGPGELLIQSAAGTVEPHSGAAGVLQGKLVALESQHPDAESAQAIDTDYANGDTVYYAEGRPGDIFYMFLANGQTTVMNPPSQMESDGNGHLNVSGGGAGILENSIVGVAEEVLANATGLPARLRVRIT